MPFGEALLPEFSVYARNVVENAQALADTLQARGFELVSGGTDNHLMLVDLTNRGDLSGKVAEAALERAHITCNKNTVPGEKRSPFVTSGIRIGTAALTTRGMGQAEMRRIGAWMADVLDAPADEEVGRKVAAQVSELVEEFPLYRKFRARHGVETGMAAAGTA